MGQGVGDVFRRGFVEKALIPQNLDGSSMELQHARHALQREWGKESEGAEAIVVAAAPPTTDEEKW